MWIDLGPWKMSQPSPTSTKLQVRRGGWVTTGWKWQFCFWVNCYFRDKFCFLQPCFHISRIQDRVRLGCFVGIPSFSTCIWPERSKKCEGIERMWRLQWLVLKAFWDDFCMDWKLMLKRKAHLMDYFCYWNDGLTVRLDIRTPWNLCYLSPTGFWCLVSLGFFPVIPVVIYLTCLFQNKLHCQAAVIQTFVLVILPELFTDIRSAKSGTRMMIGGRSTFLKYQFSFL